MHKAKSLVNYEKRKLQKNNKCNNDIFPDRKKDCLCFALLP